jgi:CRP/FNR family cyclic AMP-dependent transcriptional regulator
MELKGILKRVELFRGLTDAQLDSITAISQRESFDEGALIFEQGSPGDKMYVISVGQVEVRVRERSGGSYPAVYLGEGQVFGEMALVDESTRSASVLAVDDETILYSIPNREFTALCRADTAIGYLMMRNIAQDLSFKLRHHDFNPSDS